MDARFLEYFFHAQHFLHLVTHAEFVLKDQRDMFTQSNGAHFLVRDDAGAVVAARFGVGFERHQAVAGNFRHGFLAI